MSQIKMISNIVKEMGDLLAGREVPLEEILEDFNRGCSDDEQFDEVIKKLKQLIKD